MKKILLFIVGLFGIFGTCFGALIEAEPVTFFNVGFGGSNGSYGPKYISEDSSYNIICSPGRGGNNYSTIYLYSGSSNSPVSSLYFRSVCVYYGNNPLKISIDRNAGDLRFIHLYLDSIDLSNWTYIPELGFYYQINASSSVWGPGEVFLGDSSNNLFIPTINKQYNFAYGNTYLPSLDSSTYYVFWYDGTGFQVNLTEGKNYYYSLFNFISPPKFKINYGNTSTEYELTDNLSIYLKSPVVMSGITEYIYDGSTGINLFYNGSSQRYNKTELYLNTPSWYNNNIFTPICL